jgi:hypothetical protein
LTREPTIELNKVNPHSVWPCEDDHRRTGECDYIEGCGCSCHAVDTERSGVQPRSESQQDLCHTCTSADDDSQTPNKSGGVG